jgi:pyridoxal phosphate enzyme (YggS family)
LTSVTEALSNVRATIELACRDAGRSPHEVRLLAVSKTKPIVAIREAYAAGQRDFGESYVQELVEKADALVDLADLRWHFIGHLQTNKAKLLAPRPNLGSVAVSSARAAEALAKRRPEGLEPLRLFLEVNVSGEASKSGCALGDVSREADAIALLGGRVELAGLMTVPPEGADPTPVFRRLRAIAGERGLSELSMGMSHDLRIAIAEGATLVRVGTAIFGSRE